MNKKFYGALLMGALVMGGAFVSCSDYDDDIKDLQEQINNLNSGSTTSINDVKNQLSAVQSAASAAQAAADKAKAAADAAQGDATAAIEAAKAAVKAEALESIQAELEKMAKADDVDQMMARLMEGKIAAIDDNLNLLGDNVKENASDIKTLAEQVATLSALLSDEEEQVGVLERLTNVELVMGNMQEKLDMIDVLNGSINELADMLEMAEIGFNKMDEKVTEISGLLSEVMEKQNEMAKSLGSVNTLNVCVAKRLTSLVFAPTTYINGIEAIKFTNLKYQDWGTALKADKPATGKYYTVDKEGATAEYIVNPATVALEDIATLSFITKDATNSRAAKDVQLTVASKKIENGMLKLGLKKNAGTVPAIGTDAGEDLVIVSLKATLADKVKTAEEKSEVAVYSDWARIAEETVTPYIHNTKVRHTNGTVCNEVDTDTKDSHFWAFTEIYNKTKLEADKYTKDDAEKFIAAEQVYNKPLDLLTLVTVCVNKDDKTELKNYADYGLEFEFNLINYLVDNEGGTLDATDQIKFGKIEGTTLHSRAENGMLDNADAVGRTPVIQAVLKDKVNGKVVDVRYFKIKWTAVETPNETKVWDACDVPAVAFNCTGAYDAWIYEEYMNNLYAKIVEGGLAKDIFHATYKLEGETTGRVWAGKVDAKVEAAVKNDDLSKYTWIGTVTDMVDKSASTQTHNVSITIDPKAGVNPEVEEDFTIDAFFVYYAGLSRIIVPIKISVKAGEFSNHYNYFGSQWSTGDNTIRGYVDNNFNVVGDINKFRAINPTLYSDSKLGLDKVDANGNKLKTTQLIGSLAFGYIGVQPDGTGKAPENIKNLVDYKPYKGTNAVLKDASDIVFDSSRFNLLPNGKWNLSDDEKTLYDGLIPAAEIVGNNIYLIDNASATGTIGSVDAQPTEAALRLVGVKVPVKVVATNCGPEPIDFDKYFCYFIEPLKFVGTDNTITLIDVKNGADSKEVGISKIIKLQENFGQNSAQIAIFGDAKNTEPSKTLRAWYEVEEVQVETWNAMTTLNVLGKQYETCKTPLKNILNEYGEQSYTIKYNEVTGEISFHNASGNALSKDKNGVPYSFNVEVPVTVKTKWQKNLSAKLQIVITAGI